MKVATPNRSAPLLIANPLFGEPAAERLAPKEIAANDRAREPRRSVTVGQDRSNIYFAPLSGSTQEAKQLRTLFPNARVLSGAEASKSHLDSIRAPEILHIATHGFFLNDVGSNQATPPPDSRGVSAP